MLRLPACVNVYYNLFKLPLIATGEGCGQLSTSHPRYWFLLIFWFVGHCTIVPSTYRKVETLHSTFIVDSLRICSATRAIIRLILGHRVRGKR